MGRAENKKYHYFYKITNTINGHYYYGVHNTDDIDDGYMGSGKRLQYAYKKYGIENFTKDILKYFDTSKDAFNYEAEIVTENLVKDNSCYNCELGGVFIDTTGFVSVKDKDGNRFMVDINDERYKNGELAGVVQGTTIVEDNNGYRFRVSVKDKRVLSGELKNIHKGKLVVRDKNNNYFMVNKNDTRYLSGELKPVWSGKKHSLETIKKMKDSYKEKRHQDGEKNSQFGTCWINNAIENKKIKKDDLPLYLEDGWVKGRLISKEQMKLMHDGIKKYGGKDTIWISNEATHKSTYIQKSKLDEYLNNGWIIGRKFFNKSINN